MRVRLGPARDVLRPGRALQRGQGRAGPAARQQAVERLAADPARRRRPRPGAAVSPGTVEDRWILSRLARAQRRGQRARSRPSTSPTPPSASTTSSTASCATGTSSSSSRGSTPASASSAQTLLHVLVQTLAARPPADPVRDRGDLRPRPRRRGAARRPACPAVRPRDRRATPRRSLSQRDRRRAGAAGLARLGRGETRRGAAGAARRERL